jgi:hypothetical protein
MEIVNGYVCRDCADVAKAKRGIDPEAATQTAAGQTAAGQTAAGQDAARTRDAFQPDPARLLDIRV